MPVLSWHHVAVALLWPQCSPHPPKPTAPGTHCPHPVGASPQGAGSGASPREGRTGPRSAQGHVPPCSARRQPPQGHGLRRGTVGKATSPPRAHHPPRQRQAKGERQRGRGAAPRVGGQGAAGAGPRRSRVLPRWHRRFLDASGGDPAPLRGRENPAIPPPAAPSLAPLKRGAREQPAHACGAAAQPRCGSTAAAGSRRANRSSGVRAGASLREAPVPGGG